jgi:hypothetical protein
MFQSIELIALASLLALPARLWAQPLPDGWPLGARIPAISGQVVDAITGKPIAGLDVTLRALSARGSGLDVLRYENSRTSLGGRFSFRTSLESKAGRPPTSIKGYWLSVNLTFWSIAWMNTQSPYSDHKVDILGDPLFQAKATRHFEFTINGPRVNTKLYFPMAVQFRRRCIQTWNANCISFDETQNVPIPLIPTLDNPADCKKIKNEGLSEQCRQLNTYRSAFHHLDEALCRQVDQGQASKTCLELLHAYIAHPDLFSR